MSKKKVKKMGHPIPKKDRDFVIDFATVQFEHTTKSLEGHTTHFHFLDAPFSKLTERQLKYSAGTVRTITYCHRVLGCCAEVMSSHVHGEFTDFPLWAINMKQRLLNKLVDAKLTRCKTACVTDALGWTKEELKKKLGSRHAKKVVDQLKLFKIPLKGETREDSP